MFKYGIKLWSTNGQKIFQQAINLFIERRIDFAELYIHPAMTDRRGFKIFKDMPITIHATKDEDGFNIFQLTEQGIDLFKKQIIGAADFLNADLIVIHAGFGGSQPVFKKNLKLIFDPRMVVENMPKIYFGGRRSFGYSANQLKRIKNNCHAGFCLDIGHAIKAAAAEKIAYKDLLLDLFKSLRPAYFHLSGGFYDSAMDQHLNLYEGNIDWRWIKNELKKISKNKNIRLVFEIPKIGGNLENDLKNIEYFKNL
ncbi:MAG: TIM barrel protein [bacterium]|nr:TIM barrel protein [bacterium]